MKAFFVVVFFAVIAPLYVTYVAGAANCSALAPSKSVAGYNPVFNTDAAATFYGNNALTVSINGPNVATRAYTNATISGATSALCSAYSANSFWSFTYGNTTANCQDIVKLTMPWNNKTVCGFNQTGNDGQYSYFKGKIVLSYQEQAGNFSGSPVYRQATHNYVVYVSFPLTLTVTSSNISVSGLVNADVALTSEKYNADTGNLLIQFTVGLPYSSMLNTTLSLSTPANIAYSSMAIDNTLCTTAAGSVCLQVISFSLSVIGNSTCVFNGNYDILGFQVACRENGGVGCSSNPVDISFTLDSGNLCPQVGLTPTLTGTLAAYVTADAVSPTSSYNLGDRVFFKVTTNAGVGNTVALTFVNVTFTDGVTVFPLLTNAGLSATATSASLQVNNAGAYFSLYLSGSVFQGAIGATNSYTFTAVAQVTFAGNKKRNVAFLFDPEAQQVASSAMIDLSDPDAFEDAYEDGDFIADDEQIGQSFDNAVSFAANIAGAFIGVAVTVMVVGVYKKLTRRS